MNLSKLVGPLIGILGIVATIYLIEIRNHLKLDFNDALKSADIYFGINEFEKAKEYYLLALKYDSNNEYCRLKIEDCKQKISYTKEKELGDKYYNTNNFQLAIHHYSNALKYDLYNDYCAEQIILIKSLIDKEEVNTKKNTKLGKVEKEEQENKQSSKQETVLKKDIVKAKNWPTRFQELEGFRIGIYHLKDNSYYYNKAKDVRDKLISSGYPAEYVGLKPRSYDQMVNNIRSVNGNGYDVRYHEKNEQMQGMKLKNEMGKLFPGINIESEPLKGANDFTPYGVSIIVFIEE